MARTNIQNLGTIQYFRGDTNACPFQRTVNGSPIDITGYAYLLTVSRQNSPLAAEAAAAQIMQISGVIEPDQVSNIGQFSFAPAVLDYASIQDSDYIETPANSGILVAEFFYDIQETAPAGAIETFGKGLFQVLMDITK